MNTTIEISDTKWYQYRFVSTPSVNSALAATSGIPNLRASISTIRNSDR